MSAAAAIEVSHLSKVFGGRSAVDDVSFSVGKGEVFGFLGPNGAGKTTTVRMLGTLIAPTSGSASVAGIPLGPAGEAEIRQRISITTEAPGLYNRLTVAENLDFFARLYGLPGRRADLRGAVRSRPRRPGRRPVRVAVEGAQAARLARGRLPGTDRRQGGPVMINTARTGAVIRKELAEIPRNKFIVVTSSILPVIFLVEPTVSILLIRATATSAVLATRVDTSLFLPLLVPVLIPATMSAFSVVGEREQGTLEPVLTTPVTRMELIGGKAAGWPACRRSRWSR
jgi:hypothetical protein